MREENNMKTKHILIKDLNDNLKDRLYRLSILFDIDPNLILDYLQLRTEAELSSMLLEDIAMDLYVIKLKDKKRREKRRRGK